jgi:hypothetical protein
MELLKFNDFKKQLQKLYNYKAKEEREILYSCKLKKDPLNMLNSFSGTLKTPKKRFSNIFSNQTSTTNIMIEPINDENFMGQEMIALTKNRNNFFLEILYVNGDNIAFPYASNLNLMIMLNAKIEEINSSNKVNEESNLSNTNLSSNNLGDTSISSKKTNKTSENIIQQASANVKNCSNNKQIHIKNDENKNNFDKNPKQNIANKEINKKPEIEILGLITLASEDSSNNIISIKFSDKNIDLEFYNSNYIKECLWCLTKIIDKFISNTNVQMKGFNYKDLEDYAEKKKFNQFNKLFEIEKKKEKYEVDVTDQELQTLHHTLGSLNITSILDYDLENLNTKIEQFNIKTKEDFLQSLQGSFGKGVSQIKEGQTNLEYKLGEISNNLIIDSEMIDHVWNSIQKIEEANHRVELRWENKRKLEDYMKNLLDQLIISPSKEQTLLKCKYISNSDIIIVSEILDKFLKFFKSRKKQDVKLSILSEGRQKIKKLVDSMIINFFQSLADFIRGNFFVETFLLSELPMFNSNKINLVISKNIEKNKMRRNSLTDYLNDRKFFIQKINQLFTKSEMAVDDITFNEKKYFEEAISIMTESLGDLLNNEIVIWQDSWNTITASEMNVELMDIDLNQDSLLTYDAFEHFNKDLIFEAAKFMGCVILNSFLALDHCVEALLNFFTEKPNFFLDKNSALYQRAESEISKSIFEILTAYFDDYLERCNILLPLIYYDVLSSIHDKISKNLMDDVIYITIDDIIENKSLNEEAAGASHVNINNFNNPSYSHAESNSNRKFNFGFEDFAIGNRISLQVTKSFIKINLKTLRTSLGKFFNNQKSVIENYIGKPRRVGIIPVIRKGCNFLKLIISLTCHIKQDYIYTETEDFITKMKGCIEKIAKLDPKYTTIILLENYFYLHKFLKSLDNLNIVNPKILELDKYCNSIYEKFKNSYIEEIFSYQFKEFWEFYSKITFEYQQQGEKIKTQAAFIFNNFSKKTQTFLKEIPKNIDRFAERVYKHFCKEENLSPFIFADLQHFLQKIIKTIDSFYENCYKSPSPVELVKNAIDAVMKNNFAKLK